jgi:hypothetical protein
MYAVIRDNTFDPAKREQGGGSVAAFQRAHGAQPGYGGSVVVDLGNGRHVSITLWQSKAEAEAARVAMGPVIERTLAPMMAKPSTLVGVGEVTFDDLSRGRDPSRTSRQEA